MHDIRPCEGEGWIREYDDGWYKKNAESIICNGVEIIDERKVEDQ